MIKKSRNILITLISVCMIFTCMPMAAHAEASLPEEAVEYALCTEENGVLTPAAESSEEGYLAFIGQKKKIMLASRPAENPDGKWTKLTDEQAAALAVKWKIVSPVADAVTCTGELDAAEASKEFLMMKETPELTDIAVVSAVLSLNEGQKITKRFYIDIHDGYNPGFDPEDEQSVLKVIKDAEKAGSVISMEAGESAVSAIDANDGLGIFRFHPDKMRWYTFRDISDNPDNTCAYLYSYDSEPPAEIGRPETCDLIASKEDDEGPVMIGRDDYEGPLEQCYDSTEYYLIVKYYRSSKLGNIKMSCEISASSDIYEPDRKSVV